MAHPLGFYRNEGLSVEVVKTAGWALIRDKMINKGTTPRTSCRRCRSRSRWGWGATDADERRDHPEHQWPGHHPWPTKHKDKRDPKDWKGFKFAVPFEFSMHNMLLRYYVAEAGLNPDTDIQIRVVPPPEMVANLRAGNIDGYLGPDPFNQRAVYDGNRLHPHLDPRALERSPCCAFGTSTEFIKQNPNTFAALYRAVLTAAAMARKPRTAS